ncbi:MAG: alpha-ketoglutarate-dependent dioxygenase AlkB family protein [Gammaproteobacteria bacterium]
MPISSDICYELEGKNENLAPFDGELFLIKQFYRPDEAGRLFSSLLQELAWQEEEIIIFARKLKVPRLMCWYGDIDACYTYSGVKHAPLPWTDVLSSIRRKVELACDHAFNSVLANLYRDGRDSMGWHADKEKELGINPLIASLSFGDERLFRISHNKTRNKLDLVLGHGDLLIMAGVLQHHWRHSVPKTQQRKTERINLTFRKIIHP